MDFWPDGLDRAPVMMDKIVLETDRYVVRKLWQWNIAAAYPSHTEPGLVKCLLWGQAFNYYGCSAYIRETGERLGGDVYLYSDDFSCGRAAVYIADHGYGYIDTDGNLAIPPIYQSASEFQDGYAVCKRDGAYRIVNTSGLETVLDADVDRVENAGLGLFRFSEACRFSHCDMHDEDLSDWYGRWRYIDATGRAITDSDLLYAFNFINGIAIAARVDWTLDPKSEGLRIPHYSCDGERWGAIDREGRTVIPFVFDEIKEFYADDWSVRDVYKAHFGGWESGAWGVIDRFGKWLAEPQFGNIGYEYVRGRFTFCSEAGCDMPCGLYDLNEGRVVLPDIFDGIELYETGDIWTERAPSDGEDPKLIERRMLDASGAVKFDVSRYSWIIERDGCYEAHRLDGPTVEMLNTNGDIIDDCPPIVFYRDGKRGLQDARGRILHEPKYDHLRPLGDGLCIVWVDKKVGVIDESGSEVIPMIYENVSPTPSGTYICTARGNCAAYRIEDRG